MSERFKKKRKENFKCIKCGECCRAGYIVSIQKEDVINWVDLEEIKILGHIIINPKCISLNYDTYFNSQDGKTIVELKRKYNHKVLKKKIRELITFIENNHLYYGKTSLSLNIRTILPDMEYDPILKPNNFNIILQGIKLGLEYILQSSPAGHCNLLKLNICSFHNFKPIACKRFTYTKENCLRKDNLFLSVCRGLKKVKEI